MWSLPLFAEALRLVDETCPAGGALAAALYCNRALCLLRLDPPQAQATQQDGDCAVACAPASAKAWFRRACARRAAGDLPGALRDARQALRLQQPAGQAALAAGGTSGGGQLPPLEAASLVAALEAQLVLGHEQHHPASQAGTGEGASPAQPAAPMSAPQDGSGAGSAAVPIPGPLAPAAAAAALAQQCSSEALTVGWTSEAGRFLAAAQHLPPGVNVLRDPPFALALTRSGRKAVSGGGVGCVVRLCVEEWMGAGDNCGHGHASRRPVAALFVKHQELASRMVRVSLTRAATAPPQCCNHCGAALAHSSTSAVSPTPMPTQPSLLSAVWYCRACPLAQYCSVACREAERFHLPGGPECGQPWTALLPPEAVLALRLGRRLHEVRWVACRWVEVCWSKQMLGTLAQPDASNR